MRPMMVMIVAVLIGGPVAAQPQRDKAAARAHFDSAEAHFRAGEYREAIAGYSSSYKLFPAPLLLFNIGLCHERLDENKQAIARYREYLKAEPDGRKAGEARTRVEALEKLVAAEKTTAAERRRAQIAEKRAAIARLRSEGKHPELAAELLALYELEPDAELIFDLAVAREDAGDRDQAIAEYDRYLATEAPERATEARRRRDALAASDDSRPPPDPPPPDDRGGEPSSMTLPLTASGVAAATLIAGAVFGLSALGAEADLSEEIDEIDPPVDVNDPRFDDGPRSATIANVMFGVGLVSAGVAGYLWYRYLGARRSATPSVSVDRRGGVELGVKVRF